MSNAQYGDTVTVHYTGKLENGDIFADSKDDDPIEITIGDGKYIPGFENGVIGMEVGEMKTVTLPPKEAFGTRSQELIMKAQRSQLPEHLVPALGKQFQVRNEDGNTFEVTITELDEETVTLDANHPLAGYTLTFNIHLVSIK
jgi:peptidylprolyl isomerase